MTLVRWNPVRSHFNPQGEIDRLFGNFFNYEMDLPDRSTGIIPLINVEETDNEFNISADLPGIKKDDIKISFQNNILTISGEKKAEKELKQDNFHRMERCYGKFCRSVGIPAGVALDKIEADYKDGVLNINIPKAEEAKPKQIEIKVK